MRTGAHRKPPSLAGEGGAAAPREPRAAIKQLGCQAHPGAIRRGRTRAQGGSRGPRRCGREPPLGTSPQPGAAWLACPTSSGRPMPTRTLRAWPSAFHSIRPTQREPAGDVTATAPHRPWPAAMARTAPSTPRSCSDPIGPSGCRPPKPNGLQPARPPPNLRRAGIEADRPARLYTVIQRDLVLAEAQARTSWGWSAAV